ncbi:MAG: choice-of-anchor E domain-containing protein [Planctomycetota bacterium]
MKKLIAIACALGAAQAASALTVMGNMATDTVTYTDLSVGSATTVIGALDKFDPTLGPLVSVTLILEADTSAGSIDFDNEDGSPSDVDLGIGAEVTANPVGLAAFTVVAVPLQVGSGSVTGDTDGPADFVGTDAFSVTGGVGMDDDSFTSSVAGDLAFFTATFVGETFDVEIDPQTETFLSTTGGFGPIDPVPGRTSGTVTVKYTFVPTPGVASIFAVATLATTRRRRG